jgi:hypothetical protein
MDTTKDCGSFINLDCWPSVQEFSMAVRIMSLVYDFMAVRIRILPFEISMCISDIYLAFKMWMENVPTHSQFDCTLVILIFE